MINENAIYQHFLLLEKALEQGQSDLKKLKDKLIGHEKSNVIISITDGARRDLALMRDNFVRINREIDILQKGENN